MAKAQPIDRYERDPDYRQGDHGPYIGYIVRHFRDKGFGFVAKLCDEGEVVPLTIHEAIRGNNGKPLQEAFLHHTSMEPGMFDFVSRGRVIRYYLRHTDKGMRAVRATLLDDVSEIFDAPADDRRT